jgi:formate-dependent nitrite reductase cytochrome c552 subunit
LECHGEIQALRTGGKHENLPCLTCHSKLPDHLADATVKPITNFDLTVCGTCHRDQYNSFLTANDRSAAKVEKATPAGRAPVLDKLLMGHGFTKEHNEPRSHAFMLLDHLLVDRGYGGRFQLKSWQDVGYVGRAWDVLTDTGKESVETAKAANPTCLFCKTSDFLLQWSFLGEPHPKAKWARTSDVVELAKTLQNPMGCVHCHDPHAAKPRIVRYALIQAVSTRGATPYGQDPQKHMLDVREFRGYRKIGLLTQPNSTLQCAQCHVEYVCNTGLDPATGAKIGFDDPRTNYFPWVNVFETQNAYDALTFRDFKHAVTGAALIKVQHPEVEVFWGSLHEQAGIQCADCHMPKMKRPDGTLFTSHWQTSPRNYLKDTCLRCHADWSEAEALYRIDAIQQYTKGKMRKAEFWLERLIDTFDAAKQAGVPEDVLVSARKQHDRAHVLWEWWTAENSDGFHNPTQAREALGQSVVASKTGIELLEAAMKGRRP